MNELATTGFLYVEIAEKLENQILEGVLQVGDKLPSLRVLQQEYGVSISTILQAYYFLEAKSLIESRPRSGYYVVFCGDKIPENPVKSSPDKLPVLGSSSDLIVDFFHKLDNDVGINFSRGVPSPELLPIAKLNKVMHEAIMKLPQGGTAQGGILGRISLRRQIARRSVLWGGNLKEDDLVITSGCTSALSLSLMAVTKPGDTIAVESPVYFGLLQLADTLGLRVHELPTDSVTGLDIDALKIALENTEIKAVAIVSNFSNPLGNTLPDANKKELVKVIQDHEIPLIEDDIYGDIYYGKQRPNTCKTYDDSGLVILCGSFSKTLASGYRIGWVAAGKFQEEVLRLKLYLSATTTTITEEAMAIFLEKGRYDHHLRKLRQTLHANSLKYMTAIVNYFPENTRVSKPQGGFLFWIELPHHIDTRLLLEKAEVFQIKFTPGRLFTLQDQYNNCMRLSYGLLWNAEIDAALQKLGALVKAY